MQQIQSMTRRYWFLLCAVFVASPAEAQPRLGDDEWMSRFRDFVKSFNAFVNALNDGSFDVSRWHRVQTDWKKLDIQ